MSGNVLPQVPGDEIVMRGLHESDLVPGLRLIDHDRIQGIESVSFNRTAESGRQRLSQTYAYAGEAIADALACDLPLYDTSPHPMEPIRGRLDCTPIESSERGPANPSHCELRWQRSGDAADQSPRYMTTMKKRIKTRIRFHLRDRLRVVPLGAGQSSQK